jgi:spore coat polysaccharide biosynthesis protein SpsF
MLSLQLKRALRSRQLDALVVATSDEPIAALSHSLGIPTFIGSEEDVLARFAGAAEAHDADIVVRLTGDCPLIDPDLIDQMVTHFLEGFPQVAYAANGYGRGFARGMDVEVFTAAALQTAHLEATDPYDREHVTPFLARDPERFPISHFRHRLTVDTPEDFQLMERLVSALGDRAQEASYPEIIALLHQNPDWVVPQ